MKRVSVILIGNLLTSKVLFEEIIKSKLKTLSIITKKKSKFNSDHQNLRIFTKKYKVPITFTNNVNSKKIETFIKSQKPDYIFCIGWSSLLKKNILEIPKFFSIGFHPTELPKNRGRNPIIWSIFLKLKQTASTFFILNEKADNGPIISQKKILISKNESSTTLYKKILVVSKKQINYIINSIVSQKKINFIKPKHNKTNFWRKRTFQDGLVDWRMNHEAIDRTIKALSWPYPGAFFKYKNKFIKIKNCKKIKKALNKFKHIEPGKILKSKKKSFVVKCFDSVIEIETFKNINLKQWENL